jgi:glutathionyl-hydroquinone reductase
MVRYQGTPPDRTRPAEDAAPRRGVYVRRAVFEAALDDAIEGMEAYTEDDREELRESFLRVADELYNEGRFEMQFGKNKENYEENLKKVAKEIDLVELGKKAVRGAAMDKVLRKALRLV